MHRISVFARPDIFCHPISSSPLLALSFLAQAPRSPHSCAVIGWVKRDPDVGPHDFKENPRFRAIMHDAIQSGLRDQVDSIWIDAATQLQQGWMHIHDDRNIPALGRIGDPDDIIASVLVRDCKILPHTYQSMPSYRLCTSDGPTRLTDGLAAKLKSVLNDAIARE